MQLLDDQLELIYNSSVQTQHVEWDGWQKTMARQPGKYVLVAWDDDDDDDILLWSC